MVSVRESFGARCSPQEAAHWVQTWVQTQTPPDPDLAADLLSHRAAETRERYMAEYTSTHAQHVKERWTAAT